MPNLIAKFEDVIIHRINFTEDFCDEFLNFAFEIYNESMVEPHYGSTVKYFPLTWKQLNENRNFFEIELS